MNALSRTPERAICTRDQSDGLSIAEAAGILATWDDLAPGRARKLRTALNTAAGILAPPGVAREAAATVVPMTWPSLRRLRAQPAATFGRTEGRMTSLCSELDYILRRLYLSEPNPR